MMAAACRIIVRLVLAAALILGVGAVSAQEPERPPPLSPIEAAFSARASQTLRLFGYDHIATPVPPPAVGAVSGHYRLGVGDAVTVTFRGAEKAEPKRIAVDVEGRLTVEGIPPLMAAGRTIDDVRAELAALVTTTRGEGTAVFLSLSALRRVGVLVTGEVPRPGIQDLTAFATVFDALSAAGGVTRAGSLRAIRLFRADGQTMTVDLYGLLLSGDGGAADTRVRDGDRLVVPPLGPVIGVAGPLKRPGLFELPRGSAPMPMAEAEALAGGRLRPGPARALRLGIGAGGAETAEPIPDPGVPALQDGDLLMLTPVREDRTGVVYVDGHVRRPGPRARREAPDLGRLVTRPDLGDSAYLPFAVLARTDPATHQRRLEPVDLQAVLAGKDKRPLTDGDTLLVLGMAEVEFLTSASVLALLRGGPAEPQPDCRGLELLARTLAADPGGPLARGPQAVAAAALTGGPRPCPPLFQDEPELLPFALSHAVLKTAGTAPGLYPMMPAVARPRVQDRRAARIEVLGHVRHPGVWPLTEAATLQAALAGAGGAEPGAYPLLGVIARFDAATMTRTLVPFFPQNVAGGVATRRLFDNDRLYLFSTDTIRTLAEPGTGEEGGASAEEDLPLDGAVIGADIAALIRERGVPVRGAVRLPGVYPVAEGVTVGALLAAAGGLSTAAEPETAELTMAGTPPRRRTLNLSTRDALAILVNPGDALRVNQRPSALETVAVTLEGEVRYPGRYDVLRDDTLKTLIERAGGLSADAYPAGAIFLREAERRRKKAEFEEQARTLEAGILREQQKGSGMRQEDVALARSLADRLRAADPPGRIVVEADPAELRRFPERDVLLEPGDRIVIPKRPLTVAVSGEVMAPAALRFQAGKAADAYIHEAGGPSRAADLGRAFLLRPDGSAEPLPLSSWNHRVTAVAPGSVIVVPTDPKPFTGLDIFKDIGSVLSQLALTAASIAVISR
ncbi:protein involved in polysaccharide export with SLBB domain [Azospirillum fermentarium]|uniref:SLBB domain-containing protein n=1 Tax=Azospirillum fermentarium TaxID=1233114 RepID=UPI002225F14C|nr:SLBB domain-containing protein [Azospirillum fermentarium]MCW2247526.1 protein involved in polysaccharide export with SLBB domain [Azospirillum fermentarium]